MISNNNTFYCSATKRSLKCALMFTALALPAAGMAQQSVEVEGTTVIGDRELPIGLYISPWRTATPGAEMDKPSRYLDVATQPLDPEVFARQVEYLDALDAAARRK